MAVTVERVAPLDKDSSHETGRDDLESQSDPGQETGEVAGNAGADGQHTSEERAHGEEQTDDDEGEHEP